ncbi:MAG: EipA family protein, partial [Hyphomicrobium sp.]
MALSSRGYRISSALTTAFALLAVTLVAPDAGAQNNGYGTNDSYDTYNNDAYRPEGGAGANDAPYRPGGVYRENDDYRRHDGPRTDNGYRSEGERYGEPYSPPPLGPDEVPPPDDTYSQNEILRAGHSFLGSVSKGLASVVEYTFQKAGRPNGYILGEDAGGAFIAGLRYGEGTLYTKDAGVHKV